MNLTKKILVVFSSLFVILSIFFFITVIIYRNTSVFSLCFFIFSQFTLFWIILFLSFRLEKQNQDRFREIGATLNERAGEIVKFNLKLSDQLNVPVYEDEKRDFTTFSIEEKLIFFKKVLSACSKNLETVRLDPRSASQKNGASPYSSITENQTKNSFLFYKTAIDLLLKSIIENISSTTVPISIELLNIKNNITHFLKEIHNDRDEIKGQADFTKIVDKYKYVSADFDTFVIETTETYALIDQDLSDMNKMISKIFQTCKQIDDIAEKVNVLSINAAIESARSGEQGKGFAVIAAEIKKLSDSTKNFVRDIGNLIKDSDEMLEQMALKFKQSSTDVIEKMESKKTDFNDFYTFLTNYYHKFNGIFTIIQSMVDSVSESVGKVNPVVQLHEITVQEIENLNLLTNDFFEEEIKIKGKDDTSKKAEENAYKIRERLTTEREMKALNAVFKTLGLPQTIDLNSNATDIEFF